MEVDDELKRVFIGRRRERDSFKDVLNALIRANAAPSAQAAALDDDDDDDYEDDAYEADNSDQPHIFLFSGHGGIGKSELLKRLYRFAAQKQERGRCRVVPIIQLEESFWISGRGNVDPQQVIDFIQRRIERAGGGDAKALSETDAQISTGGIHDNSGMIATGQNIRQQNIGSAGVVVSIGPQPISPAEEARREQERKQARQQRLTDSIYALCDDLRRLSSAHPIVILLDTYELVDGVDQQLRPLYLNSGPHVLWVIAGRDGLVRDRQPDRSGEPFLGYDSSGLGGRLHHFALDDLGWDEIATYFAEVGKQKQKEISLGEQQARAVFVVTRGNPLALSMAVSIYLKRGSLHDVVARVDDALVRSLANRAAAIGDEELVYSMIVRLLRYCVSDNNDERSRLYALALVLHPSRDLLKAMMQPPNDDLASLMYDLAARYDFVTAHTRTLHDTVAYFLHADLMHEAKDGNHKRMVDELNRRACDYSLAALRHRETEIGRKLKAGEILRVEKLMGDDKWCELLLDYIHHALWLDPETGSYEAISSLCCAIGYNQTLASRLVEVAEQLEPRCDSEAREWLAAMVNDPGWGFPSGEKSVEDLRDLSRWMSRRAVAWHPNPEAGWGEARAVLYWKLGLFYDHEPNGYYGEKEKDSAKALAFYEAGLSESNLVRGLCFSAGYTYHEVKRYTDAVRAYSRAIELDPEYAYAYNNLGIAHRNLKQYEQATADYNRAIELDLKYAVAYNNRGIAYYWLKQYEQAFADFNRAIELDPNFAYAYSNRGNAYEGLKQYEQAIADINRAIELDPSTAPVCYHNLGIAYAYQERFDEALDCYQRSLKIRPDHAGTIADFAAFYALKHEPDEALAQLNKAIQLDSSVRKEEINNNLDDFSWLLANDPAFAVAFRALVGNDAEQPTD